MSDIRISVETGRYELERRRFAALRAANLPAPLEAWRIFEEQFRGTHARTRFRCSLAGHSAYSMKDRGYRWLYAQMVRETAWCAYQAGDMETAERLANESIAASEAAGFRVGTIRSQGVLAAIENRRGRYRNVFEVANRALETIEREGLPIARSLDFQNLMTVASEATHRWCAARSAAAAVTDIAGRAGFRDLLFTNWVRQAQLTMRCGDPKAAAQLFAEALAYHQTLAPNDDRAWAEIGMAEATRDESRLSSVADSLESNVDSIVWVPYQRVRAQIALQSGRTEEARVRLFRVQDWMRNGGYVPNGKQSGASRWRLEFDYLCETLISLLLREGKAEQALEVLQRTREAGDSSVAIRGHDAMLDVTLFSFAAIGGRIAVWKREGNSIEFRWASLGADEIERLARRFHRLIQSSESDLQEVRQTGTTIRDALFGTWLDAKSSSPIVIQFGAELRNVPFGVLPGHSMALGLERPVSMTASAVSERMSTSKYDPKSNFLLVDASALGSLDPELPPLTGATQEIAAIRNVLAAHNVEVLTANSANPRHMLGKAKNAGLLHFAGHAAASGRDVALLMPSPTGPTWFRWPQDPRGSCAPQLVVLSACSTGRSLEDELDSDSAGSLATGFLNRGSAEVIASMWNVDSESTALLMSRFYRELADGSDTGRSLMLAMRQLQQSRLYSHPYYWGAFARFIRVWTKEKSNGVTDNSARPVSDHLHERGKLQGRRSEHSGAP